jgi:hypothetical protein
MMATQRDPRTGWAQLEDTLTRIKPGEAISVDMLVIETGLRPETIEAVLNALTKAELFERREGNVFVRRRLLSPRLRRTLPAALSPPRQKRFGVPHRL